MPTSLVVAFSPLLALLLCLEIAAAVAEENVTTSSCTVSCELAPDIHHFGFDATKSEVQIDLKRCVKVYINPSGTSCVDNEAMESCQRECSPRSYQLELHSNRTGPFVVKTIKRCHANTHHCQSCQRKPHRLYLFPGSQYKARIDVGKCSGVCSEEGSGDSLATPPSLACKPTRTRTIPVAGPNGHVTVEVIENCSCVPDNCYRADHFQSITVLHGNRRREELVNTGRCVGNCQGVTIDGRCLQHSLDGRCLWYLPGTQGKCRPTQGSLFYFTDTAGANRTIPVVDECGCTTG